MYGKIYWANKEGNDGTLFSAVVDDPDEATIKVESKLFTSTNSLYYLKERLFFIAPSSGTLTDTALYFRRVPKSGEQAKQINMITD